MTLSQSASELVNLWFKTPKKRTEIKQAWPELAEAIDSVGIDAALGAADPSDKIDVEAGLRQVLTTARARRVAESKESRCRATHGDNKWPYVQRCVLTEGHPMPNDHIDKDGREWREQTSCDGCRTIERKRLEVPKGDEDAFYAFQRAERAHRRECPNR